MADVSRMTWEEMEVAEHEDGDLLFPAELRKRDKKGGVSVEQIRIRVPRPRDHLIARREARAYLAELKIDPKLDPDLLEQAEDLWLVAFAVRQYKAPHAQLYDPPEFNKMDEGVVRALKDQIAHFKLLLDPRESVLNDERFYEVVQETWEKRNIGPLVGIAGPEQASFIMRLVWEVWKSRNPSSSPPSSETSSPDSSASES